MLKAVKSINKRVGLVNYRISDILDNLCCFSVTVTVIFLL